LSRGSLRRTIRVALLAILLATVARALRAQDTTEARRRALGSGTRGGARLLANQANDPTAPLTTLQLRDVVALPADGWESAGNLLELQPLLPFAASKYIPFDQLLRVTLPVVWTPEPGATSGLGDIDLFDLLLVKAGWGKWGFGVTGVLPTATTTATGQGKWQVGPAFAVIVTSLPNTQIGFVLENPISVGGDPTRPAVNALSVIPTLTYNFSSGWFAGYSDFELSFDWENGGAAVPVGVQVGRIVSLGARHFLVSGEGGVYVARPNPEAPQWVVGVEVTWIIKHHLFAR
jgi:hypothetical protein